MGKDFATLGVVTAVAVVGLVVACGDGDSKGTPSEIFSFVDAAGNHCSQPKFDLTASCDRAPNPAEACAHGETACWVVAPFDPSADAGSEVAGKTGDPIWNCAACCVPPSTEWHGNTLYCTQITCVTDADCASQQGVCKASRCTQR